MTNKQKTKSGVEWWKGAINSKLFQNEEREIKRGDLKI